MIQVIDLIETDSLSETKDVWNEVSAFLGKQPGFSAGELFETFDAVHPCGDFKLTSFCCWAAEAGWRKARQAAKDDQRLVGVLRRSAAKFTSLITTLDRGDPYEAGSAGSHMVLIDVVSLDQPRMAAYAAMWTSAHKFMQNKNGFVSAGLYRVSDADSKIKFINIAVWRSADVFYAALNTPEFHQIIAEFRNDFALYLSKSALRAGAAPLRGTLEGAN